MGDSKYIEKLSNVRSQLMKSIAVEKERECNIHLYGQRGNEIEELKDESDVSATKQVGRARSHFVERVARYMNSPVCGPLKPRQEVQKRRLPAA